MENFNELINGDKPVLVDFFATWCGPCKMMHPVLEELKNKMGDGVHILKIDVDSPGNRSITGHYKISSVPTLMIFFRGEMKWRQSGVMSADNLKDNIESLTTEK